MSVSSLDEAKTFVVAFLFLKMPMNVNEISILERDFCDFFTFVNCSSKNAVQ